MKIIYASITCLTLGIVTPALCQNISLKSDTIFNNHRACALFKKDLYTPNKYYVLSLRNEKLIEMHLTQDRIQEKYTYMVTFLNDHKQAVLVEPETSTDQVVKDIVENKLVSEGRLVDVENENQFIASHSVPGGFVDSDEINDRVKKHKR